MHYIKVENGTVVDGPLRTGGIRTRWPNTSFPREVAPPEPGWVEVRSTVYDRDPGEFEVPDGGYHELRDGEWVFVRTVRAMTPEEIAARDDAYAFDYRAARNKLLQASDYTQLADYPNPDKALWATYRQELRDLPEQAGFPRNVTLPNPPGLLRDET